MKTRYIVGLFLVGASVLSSCSDFTEIDQKGMNLLSTTDQLEMLLNQEYNIRIADIQRVCGSVQYYPGNVGTVLANPVKTTTQILLKYDEAGHALEQVDLTSSDSYYANCYNYIGTVANPILSLVDAATGSEEKKTALKAEALTIRAYFHWLAAVKFTKAYDPATADSEKSIAYVLETQDIKQPTEQLTQKEVYEYILADLDAAIELNALPQSAVNRMRFNAACPHAIKAHVLMYMQQPGEAAKEAQKALAVNSSVSDYANYCTEAPSSAGILVKTFETPQLALAQDYFTDADIEFFSWLTPRYYERYEEKNIQKDWFATYHTVMWMGSWETTSQMVIGSVGRYVWGYRRFHELRSTRKWPCRTNKSERAADVSDSRRECHRQQPDRRRNGLSRQNPCGPLLSGRLSCAERLGNNKKRCHRDAQKSCPWRECI